jgi:hypothetical protein
MKVNVRPCIAYAAWRCISRKESAGIFDCSQSKHIAMTGSLSPNHLDITDQEGCRFSGEGSGSRFSLYGANRHHITLNIKGDCFVGHDYGSSTGFSGKVHGNLLNLYDCESGSSFAFRIEG